VVSQNYTHTVIYYHGYTMVRIRRTYADANVNIIQMITRTRKCVELANIYKISTDVSVRYQILGSHGISKSMICVERTNARLLAVFWSQKFGPINEDNCRRDATIVDARTYRWRVNIRRSICMVFAARKHG